MQHRNLLGCTNFNKEKTRNMLACIVELLDKTLSNLLLGLVGTKVSTQNGLDFSRFRSLLTI